MSSFARRAARLGTGEAEQERQRDVGAGVAVRIEQQGFESGGRGIAEDRDRLRPLTLDLGDHRVDERRIPVVIRRSEEADRHPGGAGTVPARAAPPRIELLPGGEHPPALTVGIVVAGIEVRLRVRDVETGNTRGRQHVFQQADLVREPRVIPECAGAPVPRHALRFVVLPRQQALADAEHQPPGSDPGDEVDRVRRVEPLQRVLLVDVENQHVAGEHVRGVDAVEQRLGQEGDRDPIAQVRAFAEQPLPGGQHAGKRRVAGEVPEADLLRARRRGQAARNQQGAQQGADNSSPAHR